MKYIRSKWFAIIGVLAAVGVTLGVALPASASIPASNGTINGCYNSSGQLRVIDSAASCPAGFSSLNWNQTGPQGATGPQGPAGATGAAGAQGPPGIANVDSGILVVTETGSGYTCSLINASGPDTLSASVTSNPRLNGGNSCNISGFSSKADLYGTVNGNGVISTTGNNSGVADSFPGDETSANGFSLPSGVQADAPATGSIDVAVPNLAGSSDTFYYNFSFLVH